MTTQEIMDLRCWCLKQFPDIPNSQNAPTEPAAAMDVLQKCAEKHPVYFYKAGNGEWVAENSRYVSRGDTLPLAIAKFARELFKEEGQ